MKRGSSGLSLVLPVRKPSGMSSHDVVNRVRRIMGERRVGHAGTLDPLATGVLPIMVGPATRLDRYMSSHDKTYLVDVVFGVSTTTDDIEGEPLHEAAVPARVADAGFAHEFCRGLVGKAKQLPPVYSAIKTNGKKACDEARRGNIVSLEPRDIEVYASELVFVGNVGADADGGDAGAGSGFGAGGPAQPDGAAASDGAEGAPYEGRPYWRVRFSVSKGTYVRSLARDMGASLGTHAHVGSLVRERVGSVEIDECVSLETLERMREAAAMDPMRFLDMRIVFPDAALSKAVENGGALDAARVEVFEQGLGHCREIACCTPTVARSCRALSDGERVALIIGNRLKAVYAHDGKTGLLRPDCIFQTGVSRGVCV